MKLPKFALCAALVLAGTPGLAQEPSPPSPQPAPTAPMPGMMMQPGGGQPAPGTPAQPQQGGMMQCMMGGMMQCPMMQRGAQTADAVKQLQQQVTELRSMLEQIAKSR